MRVSTVVIVVAVLIALGSYLMWLAGRLDRLAVRVESARASLDAQLVRRAAAANQVATVGVGPWASELGEAAALALASPTDREAVESALTRSIRAAVTAAPELTGSLLDPATRVRFARQFHNDAVHSSLALRRRRVIRWLRLWGTAKAPSYFEIDDTVG